MRLDLTPGAARALETAQQRARAQGAQDVQPADLLFGLLEEEEGRPATLLRQAGLDVGRARQALSDRAPQGSPHPAETPLPLHSATGEVLAEARELSETLFGERTVASEALLLGLLRRDAATRLLLEGHGLRTAHLEEQGRSLQAPPLQLDEPLELADTTERIDTARILDAGANRAREALRAVEDYCRFVLDDAFLTGELKRLRHDLVEALEGLGPRLLLEARETRQDVGTTLTTTREQQRHSLRAVVQANLKRLQEAFRSLEEYGKLHSPDLGAAVERLRYGSYTLERAILLGTTARERLAEARLYALVSGSACAAALDWTIAEAAAGGVQIIQLREKGLSDRALLERARKVRQWTRTAGVLFILNDRPDIARLAEADGVHLGQDELSVRDARRIVGPGALIGVSTHNLEQVRQAVLDGASYLGVGPAFPSGTKDFAELAGLEFVRQATAETSLPAFIIGGVNLDNLERAIAAGARRVAVSQALCRAADPRAVAAALRRLLDKAAR